MKILYAVLLALRLLAFLALLLPLALCLLLWWGLHYWAYRAALYRSLRRCGLPREAARELAREGGAIRLPPGAALRGAYRPAAEPRPPTALPAAPR